MDNRSFQQKPASKAPAPARGVGVAGPRHATLSRHSATLNGAPVQLNKSQKKRAAKRRAAREFQEAQARQAQEREERQREASARQSRTDSVAAFPGAKPSTRDKILRKHYRVEPGLGPDQEVARRRELAGEFGFSKSDRNLPGSGLNMDGWHNNQAEIVGGHTSCPNAPWASCTRG